MVKRRVAILASGGGSNLQALIDAMRQDPAFPAEPVLVLSNKARAKALERGKDAGVRTVFVNPAPYERREDYDSELLRFLNDERVEIVCLAGYMRILTPILTRTFLGRILNVHPALLPKFGGEGMYGIRVHEAVLKAGEKESGATVHLVDEGIDTGAILAQAKVPVLEGDTPETLAARVLEQEHLIYPQALRQFAEKLWNH